MKKYLNLLQSIKDNGTYKPAAREGMPGTQSLFGYQFRHNLADGFPILTTKKIFWKGVVVELLWFLRGDTNIKYLVDNGVNIWNEDAYNFYLKKSKEVGVNTEGPLSFEDFIQNIKDGKLKWGVLHAKDNSYSLGDCGYQYGKVWRAWDSEPYVANFELEITSGKIDQIKNLIYSLKNTPESRRHIVSAIDPAHDNKLALYWCHAMFQFNCRPLTVEDRWDLLQLKSEWLHKSQLGVADEDLTVICNSNNIPKYYLDCQLYQRSADVVLGVPFNIASYALLTEILAKICNMVPGEFIHTFGDVHIYDNHKDAVEEQLKRTPTDLPKLVISDEGNDWAAISNLDLDLISMLDVSDFTLENYIPQSKIVAELSTGLKK